MKIFRLISFLMMVSLASVSFASGAEQKKDSKSKKTETVTFDVNMNCQNCQSKIEKHISWEKGVKDLEIDLENKTVQITFDPRKNTKEKLKKAIEKLSYTCEESKGSDI